MYRYSKVAMTQPTYDRYANIETRGEIQRISPSTIHIMTDNNELLLLTDMLCTDGPNIFRIQNFTTDTLGLDIGMHVQIRDQQFLFEESCLIDYAGAFTVEIPAIIFPEETENLLSKIGQTKRADWYMQSMQSQPLIESARIFIADYTLLLKENMQQGKQQPLREILQQFIGLGSGEVASGDAFLVGMAYVTSLLDYPKPVVHDILQILKPLAQQQTSFASAQQFALALEGEVQAEIVQAVQAFITREIFSEVEEQIAGVLAIRSNAGFDILSGVLAAFEIALL